jgi:hypothetical protein
MGVTAASGFPQNSGTLIPEIWSGKLLTKFYSNTVIPAISNTDYEGEISKQGDVVKIRTVPDIIIRDYEKGQPLETQTPETGLVDLEINKAHYFNFAVDDIDKFQSDIDFMSKWTEDAAKQLKIYQDRLILADVYADAATPNQGANAGKLTAGFALGVPGTPIALTAANVLDFIVDLGTVLDEQDIPDEDRKLVLPAWAVALIKKSDLKDASLAGDGTSILRNGRAGMVDRFEIYSSNLISSVVDTGNRAFNAMAMHTQALTYAAQIVNSEVIKSELSFGHKARGLLVYGYKVKNPEALVHAYIRKG